jgi:membrane protease YdiL (CAAX protease family)
MKKIYLIILAILPFLLILLSRYFFPPSYFFSSIYKLLYLIPIIYWLSTKQFFNKFSFTSLKKNIYLILGLTFLTALIYSSAFLIAKNYIDLGLISTSLQSLASINSTNIILIGIYVIFINSLLEEMFWRGYIFKGLYSNPFIAHIVSAFCFALFHSVFFVYWFNIYLIILIFIALFIFAVVENYVLLKTQDLFSCWLIHAVADIVQITIGLIILF